MFEELSPKMALIFLLKHPDSGPVLVAKGFGQADEILMGKLVGKLNAGQTSGAKQLGEAAFRLAGFEGNAVNQKAVIRDPEEEAAVGAFGQAQLQFVPGDLELAFGAFVRKTIKPHVLHQDVQAVNESPSRGYSGFLFGVRGKNKQLLLFQVRLSVMRNGYRRTLRR